MSRVRDRSVAVTSAAMVVATVLLPASLRADKNWKTSIASGNWNTATNWVENAIPTSGDNVFIYFNTAAAHTVTYDGSLNSNLALNMRDAGTGSVTLSIANPFNLRVGWASVGVDGRAAINQSSATSMFTANSFLSLGGNATGVGTYTLSNGTVTVGGGGGLNGIFVGDGNAGTFNQSGGAVNANVALSIGNLSSSSGTYLLSGSGSLTANNFEYIGNSGAGTFIQSGGVHTVNSAGSPASLVIGNSVGSTGTYLLSGTGVLTVNASEAIGTGTFIQSGGAHTIGIPGGTATLISSGNYQLSGSGSLTVNGSEYIGGSFNQAGGAHTIGSGVWPTNLFVTGGNISGTYLLSGGSLTVNGYEQIGSNQGCTFNQSGGTHTINQSSPFGGLVVADGFGTYLLSGSGVLNVMGDETISPSTGGNGTFAQSGGTHTIGSIASPRLFKLAANEGTGTYILSGNGALMVHGDELIGGDAGSNPFGAGTFIQSGGSHVIGAVASPHSLQIGLGLSVAPGTGTYLLSGGSLTVNGSAYIGGTASVPLGTGVVAVSGGSMTVSSTMKLWNTTNTAVNLSGGALAVGSLDTSGNPARFNWTAGSLTITGASGLAIAPGIALGQSVSLSGVKSLTVNTTTTLAGGSSLSLDGGTFSTGSFNNSGLFQFNSGTFRLTASDLSVGTAGPLGATVQLNANQHVEVTNGTATVDAAALLYLSGGSALASAGITNNGQIQLSGVTSLLSGGLLTNNKLLNGTGRVANVLSNGAAGEVRVGASDSLQFQAAGNANSGKFTLQGGVLEFTQNLTNNNTGSISGRGTLITSSLTNNGSVAFSAGFSDVSGSIQNNSGAKVIVTGGSTTTFYGPVTNVAGSEFRVSTASTAVFLGTVVGLSAFTGPGTKDFEAGASGFQLNTGDGTTIVGPDANLTASFIRDGFLDVQGSASIALGGTSATVSRVAALNVSGTFDLNDNDLIVGSGTSKATIEGLVRNARHSGAWDQPGLTSSAARTNPNHSTGLGVLGGQEYLNFGTPLFDGFTLAASDVLVKYTWNGDTNFTGVVDFDDYVRVDVGFNTGLTGWSNGDFNYSGSVDFDDYVLIDVAFNTQSGTLGRALAYLDGTDRTTGDMRDPALVNVVDHFDRFGRAYAQNLLAAVPEPAFACCLGLASWLLVRHRHRIRYRRAQA